MGHAVSESGGLTASISGRVETLAVILGDQLDPHSPAVAALDPETDAVLMMEVIDEATHVWSHRQRTVLFLASMRHYALELRDAGYRVRYVTLDSRDNTQCLDGEIRRAVEILGPKRVVITEPGEWRVTEMVDVLRGALPVPIDILPDTHFTATHEQFAEWAADRKELVMEYFYREQRRRLHILLDDDAKPLGGRWNYDADNRSSFKTAPTPPRPYTPRVDSITRDVLDMVERTFPDAPGSLDTFRWATSRATARRALASFIEHRLPHFGTFQDAMWTGEPWLYHSLIGASLNLKQLTVAECVDAATDALSEDAAPLSAVEGFVRQIIGWREYIRGVYHHEGPGYRARNELAHRGNLPEFYWSGNTDMVCMSESIGQVLEFGYGHHIQRLMVTGNFALIAGIEPQQVNAWYLGMYVDAVDWVTTPNVIGMALHADGGVVGTKPYAASGRYVSKMSNYCAGCRYDPAKRVGDDACPFTTFYWDFLIRHRARFNRNHRMRMMIKNIDRFSATERREIGAHADHLRARFGIS